MARFASPSDLQAIDFYSDELVGKVVALKALETETETIPTKWGNREGLRVLAVAVNPDGTAFSGKTLSYWQVVNRSVLKALSEGHDYAVGVVTASPQKGDPTRTTVELIDPSPDEMDVIESAVDDYERNRR